MAYDPYSRGSDNPWIGNLDMPRSNPTAKPGASRAASLSAPAKKKKPVDPELLDPSLRWQNGKISRDPPATGSVAPAAPPRRPAAPPGLPPIGPDAPTRPFELTPGAQPMEQAPPIPGGLLAGPLPPRVTGAEAGAPLAPPNTPPPAQQIMNSAANNPEALRPTQSTGLDDWLKQMLSKAATNWNSPKPTNPMFDPNRPSGSVY
jgi:hypothetical protein